MRPTLTALLFTAALCLSSVAMAQYKTGSIEVTKPWSRATAQGAKVGAGYLEITNRGDSPDRLISLSTPSAGKTEIHEMVMRDNVMHMRAMPDGIALPPGQTVKLAPGGLHLMFVDLAAPLKQGQKINATLVFEKAGKLEVTFGVESIGARTPAAGGHHHH